MLEQLFHRFAPYEYSFLHTPRTQLGTILIAFLLVGAPSARAQSTFASDGGEGQTSSRPASDWRAHFDDQMAQTLAQASADVRARAHLTILHVVRERDPADLTDAVPALLDVYRTDSRARNRILAVQTLCAFLQRRSASAARVVSRLYEAVQNEPSPRVRRITVALLAEHHRWRGEALAVPLDVYVTTVSG